LSWGKYFEGFNVMMLDILPMYNKFRAPSMILVVPTLIAEHNVDTHAGTRSLNYEIKKRSFRNIKKECMVVGGVSCWHCLFTLVLTLQAGKRQIVIKQSISRLPIRSKSGDEEPVRGFLNALKEDRKGLFMGDLLRSFLFIAVAGICIFRLHQKKMNALVATVIIGVFAFIDVITIDTKYLNADHFQENTDYETNFKPSRGR
jgi:hypothetical protein